jgi:hypothetical protein
VIVRGLVVDEAGRPVGGVQLRARDGASRNQPHTFFNQPDGTFTLLMNHELGNTVGIPRAHGARGAFVSKWLIDKSSLTVQSGGDLMQQVFPWDAATQSSSATPALARLRSVPSSRSESLRSACAFTSRPSLRLARAGPVTARSSRSSARRRDRSFVPSVMRCAPLHAHNRPP